MVHFRQKATNLEHYLVNIRPLLTPSLQQAQGREESFKGYKLMTSVSIPVYNKKNHTVSEPKHL